MKNNRSKTNKPGLWKFRNSKTTAKLSQIKLKNKFELKLKNKKKVIKFIIVLREIWMFKVDPWIPLGLVVLYSKVYALTYSSP